MELVGPVIGGGNLGDGFHLDDFEYDEKDKLTRCPAGHAPVKVEKNKKGISAAFDNKLCGKCEFSGNCPADWRGGKNRYVRYTLNKLGVSRRRASACRKWQPGIGFSTDFWLDFPHLSLKKSI